MAASSYAWALDPATLTYARTLLRILHFAGLVLGLGGAVFIDLMLSRFAGAGLTGEHVDIVSWISRFIALGLGLLWLSGLGFLLLYQISDAAKLANPKIYAKMTIVAMLSANGVAIHLAVLPALRKRIGLRLMEDLRPRLRALFAITSAVSLVSWTVPVVLGAAPQLNFVVPFWVILTVYLALLLVAGSIAFAILADRSGPRADHANNNDPAETSLLPAHREQALV